jgi:hypothetical protein
MLYLSRFVPDPTRTGEFLACLWQGPVPDDLTLHRWLYTTGSPPSMVLVWEGDDSASEYVQRAFGGFGGLTTEAMIDATVMTDATPGLAACLARDLDGRRRGLEAPSQEAAAVAGRAWAAAPGPSDR